MTTPRPIIEARNISKSYRLGAIGATSLREEAARAWRRICQPRSPDAEDQPRDFWALRDLSLDIQAGEVVGIIGRNGAGKSTLLKILSRITQPTTGEISLRGRVASLLEVGTGFHPDLTGRENVFLNGAILGMTKAEIRKKFDDIVAFAEIDQFIDTPVKRYSSGMYVRLAFAVAAHLEPEILIIDEVLAVGDGAFQKKCLGKMDDIATRHGRTVLFVSHNMAAVRSLCSRAIFIDHGRIISAGEVNAVTRTYLQVTACSSGTHAWYGSDCPGADGVILRAASVRNAEGLSTATISHDEPFSITLDYELTRELPGLRVGFLMQTSDGVEVCGSNDVHATKPSELGPGRYVSRCEIPGHLLNEGHYQLRFGADVPNRQVSILTPFCVTFSIADLEGHSEARYRLPGILRPRTTWTVVSKLAEVAQTASNV
jgi:lipopolysaccharide transport system ATP-binding protein